MWHKLATFEIPPEGVQHVFLGSQRLGGAAYTFIDVANRADPSFVRSLEIHSVDNGCELIIKFTSNAVRFIS